MNTKMEAGKKPAERGNWKLKLFDRGLGIPLLFLMGLTRRKRKAAPGTILRIGLLEVSAIGDTLLVSPIIADLRKCFPEAKITAFAAGNNISAFKLLDGVDELVQIPIKNPRACVKTIRSRGIFDLWIDFGQWPRINALLSAFARARYTIGFKTKGQHRHFLYDCPVEHSDQIHELENYRNLLRPLGISSASEPALNLPQEARTEEYIVLHMFPGGSKSYIKEWPKRNWIQVIDYLTAQGRKVYLTGIAGDKEAALDVQAGCKSPDRIEVSAGGLSLRDSGRLLLNASLVVSVNTGIMHMASILKCNLVALHGPTSVKRWGPLNKNAISIQSPLPCSPCLNLGFDYGCNQNLCMQAIPPSQVIEAMESFLSAPAAIGAA